MKSIQQSSLRFILKSNFYLSFLVSFFFVLFLIGCTPYKFAYLKLDSVDLNKKLDDSASNFLLQGHITDAENAKEPIGAVAYTLYKGSAKPTMDELRHLDMKPEKFLGSFYLGNNFFVAETIRNYLKDSAGNRIKYDYMMFIPFKTKSNYIAYKLRVVGNNISNPIAKDPVESEPCPPAICPISN